MRSALLALVAALGCASTPPLRPSDPTHAVSGDPRAGSASVEGVRVTVRPADASGWVVDERLTPVELVIENGSGRTIELSPPRFAVVLPGGTRVEALGREELRRRYGPSIGASSDPVLVYRRSPDGITYFPPANLPPWWNGVVPATTAAPSAALTRADVASGSAATLLVLFPLPAADLQRFDLEADLVDAGGVLLGTARVPFQRGAPHAEPTPSDGVRSP